MMSQCARAIDHRQSADWPIATRNGLDFLQSQRTHYDVRRTFPRGAQTLGSVELPVEERQHFVTLEHLRDARVRLAPRADRFEELTVLKLDAVHGDAHFRHV